MGRVQLLAHLCWSYCRSGQVFTEQITIKNNNNDMVLDGYLTDQQVEEIRAKQKEQLGKFGAQK